VIVRLRPRLLGALVAVALAGTACSSSGPRRKPEPGIVVWAVGDATDPKDNTLSMAVSDMILADHPAALIYLGDVYDDGLLSEFEKLYQPTFGRLAPITYATPGNHELRDTPPLSGYDAYWTSKKDRPPVVPGKDNLYAADLGNGWRALGLTSSFVEEGSGADDEDTRPRPQETDVVEFVTKEFSSHLGTCYIPFMHRPRFSPGSHGDQSDLQPIYERLKDHAALYLQGHEHEYFRLSLEDVRGSDEPVPGAQFIVAGTGGTPVAKTFNPKYRGVVAHLVAPSKEAKKDPHHYGALRLVLHRGRADFAFHTLDGQIADRGSVSCDPVASRR
jgi:hypothetical protein